MLPVVVLAAPAIRAISVALTREEWHTRGSDTPIRAGLFGHPGLGSVCCDHAMTGIVEQILQEVIGFLPGQGLVGLVR
jgi:hypothetical protein